MVREECYDRIFNKKISSMEFIAVALCMNDFVYMPFDESVYFHKEHMATFAVVTDMVSIIIIFYTFNKLKEINMEYQEIMDNNIIKMSRFAIRINDILLDKTT